MTNAHIGECLQRQLGGLQTDQPSHDRAAPFNTATTRSEHQHPDPSPGTAFSLLIPVRHANLQNKQATSEHPAEGEISGIVVYFQSTVCFRLT